MLQKINLSSIIAGKVPGFYKRSHKWSRKFVKHDDYKSCHHVSMSISGFLITGHIRPLWCSRIPRAPDWMRNVFHSLCCKLTTNPRWKKWLQSGRQYRRTPRTCYIFNKGLTQLTNDNTGIFCQCDYHLIIVVVFLIDNFLNVWSSNCAKTVQTGIMRNVYFWIW